MLKRLISMLLVCILYALPSLGTLTASAVPAEKTEVLSPSDLSAQSAILTDEDGNPLFEKNESTRMGPASTTKLMTALVVAESLPLDKEVSIPIEAVGIEGSSVYLHEDEVLTVEQLLYALLLASANDAATALAIVCAGSVEAFCEKMNEKAEALGLTDTHFSNPHGLSDDRHYTTAHDLAIIASEVLRHSTLRTIVATYKTTIPLCGDEGTRVLINHNKMLRLYDGAIGCKTGFTKKTGRTLVSAAERDGTLLIAVTLNAPNDWNDHTKLLDWGFSHYTRISLFQKGDAIATLPVCGGKESYVALVPEKSVSLTLPKSTDGLSYTVEATGHFLYAPIKEGEAVARAVCRIGDRTWTVTLVAAFDVPAHSSPSRSPLYRILHFFKSDEE